MLLMEIGIERITAGKAYLPQRHGVTEKSFAFAIQSDIRFLMCLCDSVMISFLLRRCNLADSHGSPHRPTGADKCDRVHHPNDGESGD